MTAPDHRRADIGFPLPALGDRAGMAVVMDLAHERLAQDERAEGAAGGVIAGLAAFDRVKAPAAHADITARHIPGVTVDDLRDRAGKGLGKGGLA